MEGQVTFTYNEQDRLSALTFSESLTEEQYVWLGRNLPWHKSQIDLCLKKAAPHATFITKKMEVTFDMFWNRYNDKDRSSKKKTEALWNKTTEANQIKAYLYIPLYNSKRGTAEKKYATTYLSDELWNN